MENINENPVVEDIAVEVPVVEEAPVVEEPKVEETPVEPAKEEAPVESPKEETPAEPAQDAIKAPAYNSHVEEVQALGSVNNGVMGTTTAPRPTRSFEKAEPAESVEKVAIHSTKNVTWQGVGKVYRGYNIVAKDVADQWLTRSHVRLATPEEVKKAFG